ncbi:uncharacterized protein [Elaeis guineensis]|uniref:uncharacterized protein isoform X1 n=1 Tax=Elaeis guineensis var. tenera TaxID=51953 RepID=UPI003C6DAD6C
MHCEYIVNEFGKLGTLIELVPGMQIATDIICGFPGDTDEEFTKIVSLIKDYQFPQVHISQFCPRPGPSAARMKKVPSTEVKKHIRELTTVFEILNHFPLTKEWKIGLRRYGLLLMVFIWLRSHLVPSF